MTSAVRELIGKWRRCAALTRHDGFDHAARAHELCASDLERALSEQGADDPWDTGELGRSEEHARACVALLKRTDLLNAQRGEAVAEMYCDGGTPGAHGFYDVRILDAGHRMAQMLRSGDKTPLYSAPPVGEGVIRTMDEWRKRYGFPDAPEGCCETCHQPLPPTLYPARQGEDKPVAAGGADTPFSKFIREATPDEKAKVYGEVLDRATAQQQAFLLDEEADNTERSMGMAFERGPRLAAALRAGASALRSGVRVEVTEEMVENAARALCERAGGDPDNVLYTTGTMGDPGEPWGPEWAKYEDDARAALQSAIGAKGDK